MWEFDTPFLDCRLEEVDVIYESTDLESHLTTTFTLITRYHNIEIAKWAGKGDGSLRKFNESGELIERWDFKGLSVFWHSYGNDENFGTVVKWQFEHAKYVPLNDDKVILDKIADKKTVVAPFDVNNLVQVSLFDSRIVPDEYTINDGYWPFGYHLIRLSPERKSYSLEWGFSRAAVIYGYFITDLAGCLLSAQRFDQSIPVLDGDMLMAKISI